MTTLTMFQTFEILKLLNIPATFDKLVEVSGQDATDVALSLKLNSNLITATQNAGNETVFTMPLDQERFDYFLSIGKLVKPFHLVSTTDVLNRPLLRRASRIDSDGIYNWFGDNGYYSTDPSLDIFNEIISNISGNFPNYTIDIQNTEVLEVVPNGTSVFFRYSFIETFDVDPFNQDIEDAIYSELHNHGFKLSSDLKVTESDWQIVPIDQIETPVTLSMVQTFNLLKNLNVPATLRMLSEVSGQSEQKVARSLDLNLDAVTVTPTDGGETVFSIETDEEQYNTLYDQGKIMVPFVSKTFYSSLPNSYLWYRFLELKNKDFYHFNGDTGTPGTEVQAVMDLVVPLANTDRDVGFYPGLGDVILTAVGYSITPYNVDVIDIDLEETIISLMRDLGCKFQSEVFVTEEIWKKLPGSLI